MLKTIKYMTGMLCLMAMAIICSCSSDEVEPLNPTEQQTITLSISNDANTRLVLEKDGSGIKSEWEIGDIVVVCPYFNNTGVDFTKEQSIFKSVEKGTRATFTLVSGDKLEEGQKYGVGFGKDILADNKSIASQNGKLEDAKNYVLLSQYPVLLLDKKFVNLYEEEQKLMNRTTFLRIAEGTPLVNGSCSTNASLTLSAKNLVVQVTSSTEGDITVTNDNLLAPSDDGKYMEAAFDIYIALYPDELEEKEVKDITLTLKADNKTAKWELTREVALDPGVCITIPEDKIPAKTLQ